MLEIKVYQIKGICPDHAYMQCVDPGSPYTDGGTVIFQCCKIKEKKSQ